ncbi:MAG: ubiquitin-like protein Pup [Leptospirales bacterium]
MAAKENETRKSSGSSSSEPETETAGVPPAVSEKAERLKEEADQLVDRIDEVLEENAESFVKAFIQKGGE